MNRIFLTLLLSLSFLVSLEAQTPNSEPAKFNGPSLVGKITWTGKSYAQREVLWPPGSRGTDVLLERMLIGKKILDTSLLVDEDSGGIGNCAVWLNGLEIGAKRPGVVPLTLKDMAFEHRVVFLRPGGRVHVHNKDPRSYRFLIRNDAGAQREFEVGPNVNLQIDLPKTGRLELVEKSFPFIKAMIHRPGWRPSLITDKNGSFEIRGLNPGQVELVVHHEVLGTLSKKIEIDATKPTMIQLSQDDFVGAPTPPVFEILKGSTNPALRINGVAVGQEVFNDVLKFVKLRYDDFPLPGTSLKRYVIARVFLPLVASLTHHVEEFRALRIKAVVVDKALAKGKTFRQAAEAIGAPYLAGKRPWVGRRELEPWLGTRVFSAPKNIAIGPFVGAHGIHYIRVEASRGRGDTEKRQFSHIFLRIRPDLTPVQFEALIEQLSLRARAEALIPDLKGLIPEINNK